MDGSHRTSVALIARNSQAELDWAKSLHREVQIRPVRESVVPVLTDLLNDDN